MSKIAYLFAGQGAQYVGMGKDLYEAFPESKAVFDKAEVVLGIELKRRCFEGPEDLLKITNVSQPAIVTVSIAALAAFKAKLPEIKPEFLAGLSLGEYSALIAAESFSLEEGLLLIKKRGQIMEEASRRYPGKMAAVIDLPVEKIKEICFHSGAEVANLNCPGQTVITGKAEVVDIAIELCNKAGAKRVVALEVSGGFHSSLMFEASGELRAVLESMVISNPKVPVVSNYTADPQYRASQIFENLIYQIRKSVLWEESMRFLLSQGVTTFYEFGPGKVLKGLMRRIDSSAQVITIEKKDDIFNLVREA
ncbi:MAG: ACP S-malonyltransferase [Candidatus Omnitrophica bacterium]|nr:ACP S-malonyltransferase [Candidatus Omnitrophota bacterium]